MRENVRVFSIRVNKKNSCVTGVDRENLCGFAGWRLEGLIGGVILLDKLATQSQPVE